MADRVLDAYAEAIGEFPIDGPPAAQLRAVVRYAVLAPSSHNTQPWRFRVRDDALEVLADRSRALPVIDPDDRELFISCGAALFNARVALRRFGHAAETTILPDREAPDLVARLRVGRPHEASDEDRALFDAMFRRRTFRHPFEDRPVAEGLLEALVRAAETEGAWLRAFPGRADRDRLAALVAEGDRQQMANRSFRRELALWLHPDRAKTKDGMPGSAIGLSTLMATAGPLVVRTFDVGRGRAAWDRELAERSPVIAVLGTHADGVADWIGAGQALERVLLRACVDGVYASYLNQPIETPALRESVRGIAEKPGYPQILVRLGYGHNRKPSPRRDVEDVLIE